jgi:hypothetical protein
MSDQAKVHFDRYRQIAASALRIEAALPGDRDWCCVLMFYAALHLLDAYLCTKVFAFAIDSHVNRNRAIRQSPELGRFGSSYRELQDLSEQVRYDPGFTYKTVYHGNAKANLAKVAGVLESKVKKRLGIP